MFQTAQQFVKLAADYNNMMMEGWQQWTKHTIQSEAFASASGAMMDWTLATQKMMTDFSGQYMESMDIPKRSDLARLSAQVQAVESRLLDQEDNQDDLRELLTTLIKKIDEIPTSATDLEQSSPRTAEEKSTKKPATRKRASAKSKSRTSKKRESK